MPAAPADEVDRIVEAWRRERPDLDVAPLTILSRVLRLARHLDLARGSAFAEHDLEGWGFDVLSALRREGPPYELSPGQLVAQTLVTSGTMTNRVDRLAARGLVSRGPDASDPTSTSSRSASSRASSDSPVTSISPAARPSPNTVWRAGDSTSCQR